MSEEELCYICFGDETDEIFMKPSPCNCKGSIKIHKSCLDTTRFGDARATRCGICKSEYVIENEIKTYERYHTDILKSIVYVVNGKKEGFGYYYDLWSGDLDHKIFYKNDVVKSHFQYTKYTNRFTLKMFNALKYEKRYLENNNVLLINYYSNGVIESETEYKDNIIHGTVKNYYLTKPTYKILKSVSNYVSGKQIDYKEYHINGKLKCEKSFDSFNRIEGVAKTYYDTEALESESNYSNGVLHGTFKEYYPNGVLKTFFTYVNGREYGTSRKYFQNKELSYKALHDGCNKSVWTYYENGKVESESKYSYNSLVSSKKFSKDGKVL